tara:strand:+ start:2928 stop:3926 length:999 start_codon:yes stop_codon:yes gene_type:complete
MNVLALYSGEVDKIFVALPALSALHKAGHRVFLLVDASGSSFEVGDILEDLPYIECFKIFDSLKDKNGDVIISWIVKNKIDTCLELFPRSTSFKWLFPYLSCETILRPCQDGPEALHPVDINIKTIGPLVGDVESKLYDMATYSFDSITEMLSPYDQHIVLVICPGYKKDGRSLKSSWGVENYARLINLLPDDVKAFLVDDNEGVGVCNHINHLAPRAVNLAGLLSVKEACAMIGGADIIISNDSHFAHIASALNKHLMVFLSDNNFEKNRPMGPRTVVLKSNSPEHKCTPNSSSEGCFCIASIPAESIYNAIVKHILPDLEKNKTIQPIPV